VEGFIHEQTLNEDHKTTTDQGNQSKCSPAEIEAQQTNSDKNKKQWGPIGIRITNTFNSALNAIRYTKHRSRLMSIAFNVKPTK
jgi:hypothetical protein